MANDLEVTVTYSKDDFIYGTAPYEEVYRLRNDKFEMDRAKERLSEMAKSVGFSNFKTHFKNYMAKVGMTDKEVFMMNTTDFDGQPLELITGDWVADDNGVTRKYGEGEIMACFHPIMPVKRLVNVDSGIEKLEIAFKKGHQWRRVIFDKKQLASANSIVGALADYGVAVTSENAKYLVQYLHDVENLNYDKIPENNSVSRLGWIGEEGFSPYVEDLIFDGDISFKHYFESVKAKGSFDKWIKAVRDIRAQGNVPAKILVAASFASVLVEPCNCLPFFVHLWGGTETGKTAGLMLAASVWANPEMGKYIHTFNSTAVAQELSAGFVNSLPLMLDELQIIREKKDFDQMIYQLSEGVGRSRGQKTGGLQRTTTWQNCIMTTGEQPISSGHSGGGAVNRIIEISCEDAKLFDNPVEMVGTIKKNYGHAGKVFIDALNNSETMELARSTQKALYQELVESQTTEKQALAASLILTADALIDVEIFKDNNGLTVKDITTFLSTKSDVSVNLRALDWLMEWLAQNRQKFEKDNEKNYEIWGEIELNTALIIRSVFNKACQENGYSAPGFLAWLKRKGYIDAPDKRFDKTKRIGGMPCHCVVLRLDLGEATDGFQEVFDEQPF